MTRLQWLTHKHKELDRQVTELELEREFNRTAEHKALLLDLKKQRLKTRDEILELGGFSSVN
jgi:uncharacterized protein YdcH (DUF465 family)